MMATDSDLVRCENVRVVFGKVTALDGLSCSIGGPGVTGIIGPNGSGKSTFVNVVSGALRPKSGRVEFSGRDVTKYASHKMAKLGLARTFQQSMVFSGMSVLRNVEVALEASSRRRGDAVEELCADPTFEPLWDHRDDMAGQIPFGLARYLGIVVAMACRPKVLFLDEPAAGLNDAETSRLADSVSRIAQRGINVVVIDHDMKFLLPLCSRIVVLDAGTMIADGTPDEVRVDRRVISVYLGDNYA